MKSAMSLRPAKTIAMNLTEKLHDKKKESTGPDKNNDRIVCIHVLIIISNCNNNGLYSTTHVLVSNPPWLLIKIC